MNCPNGTINVASKKVADADGKEKRVLDAYTYDLGCCTFCGICVQACPQSAIAWSPSFEHAVFTRSTLMKRLNKENSTLMSKN
jgi:NADH-quinone oxidoreductase subunit I